MAEDILLKTLEEDSRARAADILEEAERRAREIVEAAENEIATLMDERLKGLHSSVEKERSAALNRARVRSGALMLEVRRALAEEVLESAIESFRRLNNDEYTALLNKMYSILKKDWQRGGGARPVVRLNPADIGKVADSEAEFVSDTAVELGVVFATADNRVRKELTVPSILKKARKTLETGIDKTLFGGD